MVQALTAAFLSADDVVRFRPIADLWNVRFAIAASVDNVDPMANHDPRTFKRLAPPEKREKLDLIAAFSDAEGDRMKQGFAPRDDRWFIYFEDGWLNFHRSWTGAHIYALKLDGSPSGVRVVDGWVSRDAEHYRSPGIEHDREFVVKLVQSLFEDGAQGG